MTTEPVGASKLKSKLVPIKLKVSDRRVERHEQRRLRYLDEAMNIIVEQGVEQLTIANLATRMQGSKGAVYRYFPSKDALLIGLQERAMDELRGFVVSRLKQLETVLTAETDPRVVALSRLSLLLTSYIEHGEVSPREHRLIDDYVGSSDPIMAEIEARQLSFELAMRVLSIVQEAFEAAVELHVLEPGDALERAMMAWAFVHGLDHFRKGAAINPPNLQLPVLMKASRQTFLRGLGASPELLAQSEALLELVPLKKA